MVKLKCLFIGKQVLSLKMVYDYAANIPSLTLLAKPIDTLKEIEYYIDEFEPDIIFCDAQYISPEIQIILTEKIKNALIVILATAQEKPTADIGYKVFCFISKPVTLADFLQTIEKINGYLNTDQKNIFNQTADFVFIKSAYKFYKIKFSEILFCEGMKDYTQVHTINREKPIITLQNLKTFVGKLPADKFIRIHRSFVVSLNNIDMVSKNELTVGKKNLPIGESFREQLFQIIKQCS